MNKWMITKEALTLSRICLINKQTTPSVGNQSNNSPLKKPIEAANPSVDLKPTPVKQVPTTEKKITRENDENDSFAIIDSIVNNDDIKVGFPVKSNPSAVYKRKNNPKFKEQEVRLFEEDEKSEYESVAPISECQTERSAFVMTPSKMAKNQANGVNLPMTKKIGNKKTRKMKKI